MGSIERTAYPRFNPSLTATELHSLYCPTEEERDFIATHARGVTQQLTLLTLLKCHQHLGYLPALADVPTQIRTYLCQQLSKIQKVLSSHYYLVSQKSPERIPAFRSRSCGVIWRRV